MKEKYQSILARIESDMFSTHFICKYIKSSGKEIYIHFLQNKPSRELHSEFYDYQYFNKTEMSIWWLYPLNRDSIKHVNEQKCAFLKKLINNL